MPKRIPNNTVVLMREGKRVKPAIGKVFDFTQAELDSINAANPKALRHPVNEDVAAAKAPAAPKAVRATPEQIAADQATADAAAQAAADAAAKVAGEKTEEL